MNAAFLQFEGANGPAHTHFWRCPLARLTQTQVIQTAFTLRTNSEEASRTPPFEFPTAGTAGGSRFEAFERKSLPLIARRRSSWCPLARLSHLADLFESYLIQIASALRTILRRPRGLLALIPDDTDGSRRLSGLSAVSCPASSSSFSSPSAAQAEICTGR